MRIYFLFLISFILSCQANRQQIELTGSAMGTTYSIKYYGGNLDKETLETIIKSNLDKFNTFFSTYLDDSEISKINQLDDSSKQVGVVLSKPFKRILEKSLSISKESKGFFDPTIYPLVRLWQDTRKNNRDALPSEEEIRETVNRIGYQKLNLDGNRLKLASGMELDFSAIAKGSGVDMIADIFEENGIENYFVEIGGEIKVGGVNAKGKPWKIMIAPPHQMIPDTIVGLSDMAIATSGDYQNFFIKDGVRYSHLLNPQTGKPILHELTSVSVIADNCEDADAWATALIVMGKDAITFSEEKKLPALFMIVDEEEKVSLVVNSFFKKYLIKD